MKVTFPPLEESFWAPESSKSYKLLGNMQYIVHVLYECTTNMLLARNAVVKLSSDDNPGCLWMLKGTVPTQILALPVN